VSVPAKKTATRRTTKTATKRATKGAAKPVKAGGSVVATYLAQQSPEKRVLLERLSVVVAKGAPDATPTSKWGIPVYVRNGKNICALASFKDFVAINFFAPAERLVDPGKKLEGAGKSQRMLKVRSLGDIDAASIQRWLKVAGTS
jgi:hypothetical protein